MLRRSKVPRRTSLENNQTLIKNILSYTRCVKLNLRAKLLVVSDVSETCLAVPLVLSMRSCAWPMCFDLRFSPASKKPHACPCLTIFANGFNRDNYGAKHNMHSLRFTQCFLRCCSESRELKAKLLYPNKFDKPHKSFQTSPKTQGASRSIRTTPNRQK